MSEAKTPDNSDWQYVDIFVFSNGQQATPPRKYHLSIADLNSWTNTLRTLARSQYEKIFSSIDLYTVEGQPVLTPMQVTHGAAYVAVPPHDTFITAGYNDYLMKASKSRERRKSRNLSIVENVVDKDDKERDVQVDTEEQNMKIMEDEKEIRATNDTDGINENNTHKFQNQVQRSNNTEANTLPEKQLSNNRTSVGPKNSMLLPHMIRRTSLKNKDSAPKKSLKVTTDNVLNTRVLPKPNGNNNFTRPKAKSITKPNKTSDKETAAAIPTTLSTIDENLQTNISNLLPMREKSITTDNSTFENAIDDKELIVFKYPDSEITTILFDKDRSNTPLVGPPLKTTEHLSTTREHTNPLVTATNNGHGYFYQPGVATNHETDHMFYDKENTKKINEISLPRYTEVNDEMALKNKPHTDSFVTVIEKRDVVNLNLKIELRNCDGIGNTHCEKNPTKLHYVAEKSSQINIEHDFSVNCSAKQSKITGTPVHEVNNSKILLVPCACCNPHNFNNMLYKIGSGTVKLEDTNYVILLPSPQLDKMDNRCNDQIKTKTSGTTSSVRDSAENPIKKVYALHLIEALDRGGSDQISPEKEEPQTPTAAMENIQDGNEQYNIIEKGLSAPLFVTDTDSTNTKQLVTHDNLSKKIQKREFLMPKQLSKSTKDSHTQTDWCTMLLEARRKDNGCYTFHLPPLEVLKYYGF